MNKLEIAKTAVGVVVGSGTTKIITAIVKNNIQIRQAADAVAPKVTDKAAVAAGAFVLGAMVADISKRYTDTKIDEIATWWTENVTKKSAA